MKQIITWCRHSANFRWIFQAIIRLIIHVSYFSIIYRDVDKVHDLMDEVAEQQEIAQEISDAISNPVGFGQDADEVIHCIYNIHNSKQR